VLSEYAGIQKVAKGSRAWQEAMYTWANAIEDARGAETLALGDLSDVSAATGPLVDHARGRGERGERERGSLAHAHGGSCGERDHQRHGCGEARGGVPRRRGTDGADTGARDLHGIHGPLGQ
jgi:hypothetical protein